ncbi:acyl-CoA/acyl-ACP dehydrogenase [Amycolatopsis sp. K13G38]|uniref:Acyl-CoA/acyl-ACP dehydrogenase n=1 Tax=Amycolatopsis acididurans TaxID=2724524 RepID=A0ABX1JBA8_9PSEU|nr:acyl-CoA dehydrogenase family protein [Amycolatopsis acididurans]NKQ57051.1 acyl-CoA/acyl-ACP dehydrogenase [Amycolatopsis acididurans]
MSGEAGIREQLRAEVRRCLSDHVDVRPYFAEGADSGPRTDEALWRLLATQMNLPGLIVPEADGGAGAQLADLAVVFEELGAALAPVPMFATAGFALPLVLAVAGERRTDAAGDLLAAIASGTTTVTVALNEPDGGYRPDSTTVRAVRTETGWSLSGSKSFVIDAPAADIILVPAWTSAGIGLFAADRGEVAVSPMPSLDLLRPLSTVRFDGAPARLISDEDAVALDAGLDLALVLLAAEQVGGAQRCLDNAVAYAKQRVQFGRPIGSFQAIKHQLVDLLLQVEMARSAMTHAIGVADSYLRDPGAGTARDLAEAASLSRALCSDTFTHVADEALHIHGGIGFTWEHDSHLYYRRAKATELLFGIPDAHRERLAAAAGL